MKIHVSQDGKIFINGTYMGFVENEKVFIIESGGSREIGGYDHRSEITALVLEWYEGKR